MFGVARGIEASYLVDLAASWLPELPRCDPLARKAVRIAYI